MRHEQAAYNVQLTLISSVAASILSCTKCQANLESLQMMRIMV